MGERDKTLIIVIADDDPDDRLLAREALNEGELPSVLHFVEDGEELMDFLRRRGKYGNGTKAPRPDLILLDLNMPKKDGREVILEVKSDPALRRIPIVVLTTSKAEEDVLRSYDLGVNSFIVKPVTFEELVDVMKTVNKYWSEVVRLPQGGTGD